MMSMLRYKFRLSLLTQIRSNITQSVTKQTAENTSHIGLSWVIYPTIGKYSEVQQKKVLVTVYTILRQIELVIVAYVISQVSRAAPLFPSDKQFGRCE